MSYQKERDEFIAVMTGQGVPLEVTRLVIKDATTVQRLAVAECERELSEKEKRRDELAQARIKLRLAAHGVGVKFNGDPRGYAVKLLFKSGLYNTWGGVEEGWGVPTRI